MTPIIKTGVERMSMYTLANLPLNQELETKAVLKKTISANRALAELKGLVRSIPNKNILINTLALQEAKDSSEIENIVTTYDELYRSEVVSGNISHQAKEVQRYRQALYRGFALVNEHNLFLKKHIIEIQKILENNDAGIRTQAGTVLKNELSGEVVYEPPQDHQSIQNLMDNLEEYINQTQMDKLDPLVKMAIIHYQFESIHPFYDGNGRTGRIVNILYLILSGLLEMPILYLSSYIIRTKVDYYRLLNEVRVNNAWEQWIIYMLDSVEQTALNSIKLIENIERLMLDSKQQLMEKLPKIYSKDLLEVLFKQPYIKIGFLVDELKITRKTASLYLKEIENIGILEGLKTGRDVYFINKKLFALLRG